MNMPAGYIFSDAQKSEIKKALKTVKDTKIYKRLEALQMRSKGSKREQIAEITGFNISYISQLVAKYFRLGIQSIIQDNRRGNNGKLTREQEKELLAPFKEMAERGEMLVVADIKAAYDKLTGEESSVPTVYHLLKRHNWRKIMPRSRHPKKASDEQIDAYKKNHRENP